MMRSLHGRSKCTSPSHEAAANPHPHSCHMNLCISSTVPGAGKCEIMSLRVHFFPLPSHRKSSSSKKHHLRQTAGVQLSLWRPGFGHADGQSPATTHLMRGQNRNRKFYSWAGHPQNSHFAGEVCYCKVVAKISLLFGNNGSWNPLFCLIFFFLFMRVGDEHSLYSLMVCKIQYM